jgi:hypothetical protein
MPNPIDMTTPDVDISADFSFYWSFYPITTGSNTSDIYKDDDRYVITQLVDETSGGTQYQEILMEKAEVQDYNELIQDNDVDYLKIELSQGGRSTRTNFHDNSLKGGFYLQNNKYFEILGQEGGYKIDVSINDITQTAVLDPNANPDYVLPQEFAWKTIEWYMSDTRRRFLEGEIIGTNIAANRILVQVEPENTATTFGQRYFNLGTRELISFYQRFTESYPHDINSSPRRVYSKFKGWYMHSTGGAVYAIKDIMIDPARTDGNSYQIIVEFEEEPTDFSVRNRVFSLFDRTAHPKNGSFNGSHLVDVSEIPAPPGVAGDTNTRICLDGFWLSPRINIPVPSGTRLGLCGGRYWGLGDRAPDNENAIIFMRSPEGILGLSSMYHKVSNQEFVLFYDHDLKTLNIRRATIQFSEYPSKYEVSIGPPASISNATLSTGTNTSIDLDSSQNRTKTLSMGIPYGNEVMLFSVGSLANYYGSIIRGLGKMNLYGFEVTGVPQDASAYKYNNDPVSPIYEYRVGKHSATRSRDVHVSVKTSDSPIIVNSPSTTLTLPNVQIQYVNENQTIDNARLFDIYEIDDDELMIFMGRRFPPFTVDNPDATVASASNSSAAGTRWEDSSGIFVIGSKNTGVEWGNPIKPFKEDDQYGLLILDSADYCCSIYNGLAEEIVIFFVSKISGQTYLGAFIVGLLNLPYKNYKCTPDGSQQEFLWRPPALPDTEYTKQVVDGFIYDPKEEEVRDKIIVVASESPGIDPQITVTNVTDFGILSTYTLSDGRMVVFYDSLDGIKMVFSEDSGRSWKGSSIILAQNGKSAVYTGGLLIYIASEGIVSKVVPETILTSAFAAVEGSVAPFVEIIQNTFDNQIITSLGTGDVPTQKLSAHKDETGVFHVFYYGNDGRLCSTQGTALGWGTTDNF